MSTNKPELSEAERQVLHVLWDRGGATVRQVQEVLAPEGTSWAYTTVQTLLQRLRAKGYATVETGGSAHVYRPAAGREEVLKERLDVLADRWCAGESAPLVMALVEGGRFTEDQIARFRRLIDGLEATDGPDEPGARSSG